jgi:radical SAM protein with 4Fe4S-binding SPASM domain
VRLLQRRPGPASVRQGHLSALHFEIVRGCQLRCLGCPVSGLLPKVERISVELFDRCLRNVDVDSVENLRLFNFGEPLLHHDLPGIVARIPCQSWSVKEVEISTNAQHVDWLQLEEVVRMGVLTRMVVSCDGDATAESYETLRPPSKWERLIEFLGRMRELRDRHAPGLELTTRTIVPEWQLRRPWNDLLEPLGWRPEFRHFYYLPDSCQNATGRDLEKGLGVCFFVGDTSQLYVDSEGTVVPCCAHPRAGAYGSLADRTFSQILAGKQRRRFVARLASSRDAQSVCSRCEFGPADSLGPTRAALFPDSVP